MKTLVLKSDSGCEKPFGLAHAQAVLLHQDKVKAKDKWSIVGDKYEFNGVTINAVRPNTGHTKGKTKSNSDSASETPTE